MPTPIDPVDIPYRWIRKELVLDRTYRLGDRGNRVKTIQEWLSLKGPGLRIDGDFGPATERVVREFQSREKIAEPGKVDELTFRSLVSPMLRVLAPLEQSGASYGEHVVAYASQHLSEHPREIGG